MERYTRSKCGVVLIITFCVFLLLISAVYAAPLLPDAPAVKHALNYIKASQRDDGGFGLGGATEWIVMAIAAAGQDPRQWQKNGNTPLDYLSTQRPTRNPYDWIRMALALIAIGEDPRNFGGVDYIKVIREHYQGGQFGDPLSLRDDYWAVLALVGAGEKDSKEVQDSVQFILERQHTDGSWSAAITGIETCADNTAIAQIALRAAGQKCNSEAIAKALTYLKAVQRPDGGFSYLSVPSNAASDSWVMQALWAVGEDPSSWKQERGDLTSNLLRFQQPDGSFRWTAGSANSPLLMTAYALPALLGKWYPISPSQSNLITISVRIEGKENTILNTPVTLGPTKFQDAQGTWHTAFFPTPLSAVAGVARTEGIGNRIENSPLGLYIKSLCGESDGWQYRVNNRLPMLPAHEYRLKSGDDVIWFYDCYGHKSPLRLLPERLSAWERESIKFRVEHFDDADDQWKLASRAAVVVGNCAYPAPQGELSIRFEHKGVYFVFAHKHKAIRSVKNPIVIEAVRPVTVRLHIEDNGEPLCEETVTFSSLETTDINGRTVIIRRPVLLGAIEAACQKGLIAYQVIQTAEGVILVSIDGRAEDNEHGSWWYQVNGRNVLDDIDEYELKDNDTIFFYRSKHP